MERRFTLAGELGEFRFHATAFVHVSPRSEEWQTYCIFSAVRIHIMSRPSLSSTIPGSCVVTRHFPDGDIVLNSSLPNRQVAQPSSEISVQMTPLPSQSPLPPFAAVFQEWRQTGRITRPHESCTARALLRT